MGNGIIFCSYFSFGNFSYDVKTEGLERLAAENVNISLILDLSCHRNALISLKMEKNGHALAPVFLSECCSINEAKISFDVQDESGYGYLV